jgi:hypothetical protein
MRGDVLHIPERRLSWRKDEKVAVLGDVAKPGPASRTFHHYRYATEAARNVGAKSAD